MIRISLAAFVTLGVFAGGCTSFDSIDRDVCGNGLIEAGEDCDSNDSTCVRCAVVCSAVADCPTPDYACGVDGLCHAPGGALEAPVPAGPFQVGEFHITDLDHDGTGDVLGLSRTSVVIRHGEASGRLSALESLITPSQSGPPAVGDLDNDGSLDVTITTPDGLVSYTSPYGTLSPVAVQSLVLGATGSPLDVRMMFRINDGVAGAFVVDENGQLFIGVIDLYQNSASTYELPCSVRLGAISEQTFQAAMVDVYSVRADAFGTSDAVVSFATTGATPKLCVTQIHKQDNLFVRNPAVIEDVTPLLAVAPTKKPILADLDGDGDGCPGLVNVDGGRTVRWWPGDLVANRCTLRVTSTANGDALPMITEASGQAVVIDRLPLQPPIAGFAADTLVMTDGVYSYGLGAISLAYRSPRKLLSADHGDLNGDGYVDGILVAEVFDDLDLLLRTTTFIPSYQLLRLDTASRVTATQVGDFDGNGITDLAFIEQLADHQRLMVSYATTDRPLEPIELGAFDAGAQLTQIGFPDSVDLVSLAADLVVLQPGVAGSTGPSLTILHGSPQRTMLGYFDPRIDDTPEQNEMLFRGAIAGRFQTTAGTDYNDLLAIAIDPRNPPSIGPRVWRVPGTSHGPDATESAGFAVNNVADCTDSTAGNLCVQDAAYFAWSLDPTRDVVIAIDRAVTPHAIMIDPSGASSVTAVPIGALSSKISAGTVARAIHAADLDGDGAEELVAVFAPRTTSQRGGVLVCTMSAGTPQSCTDLVPELLAARPDDGMQLCVDAAPARITYRDPLTPAGGAGDLVVLCRGSAGSALYRVRQGASGLDVLSLAVTPEALNAIQVGDVTGDGLDDVVALEGESGVQSLVVFPQCSSRGLGSCSRGGGS